MMMNLEQAFSDSVIHQDRNQRASHLATGCTTQSNQSFKRPFHSTQILQPGPYIRELGLRFGSGLGTSGAVVKLAQLDNLVQAESKVLRSLDPPSERHLDVSQFGLLISIQSPEFLVRCPLWTMATMKTNWPLICAFPYRPNRSSDITIVSEPETAKRTLARLLMIKN